MNAKGMCLQHTAHHRPCPLPPLPFHPSSSTFIGLALSSQEYQEHVLRYSNLIEKLPTRAFLVPLKEDEEVEIELSKVGVGVPADV